MPPRLLGELSDSACAPAIAARERTYRRLLAYADALAAIVALYSAIAVIGHDRVRPVALLAMPAVVVASKLMGLYDRDGLVLNKTTLEDSAALFQLASIFTLLTWLLEGIVVDGELGHRQVLGLWGLLFVTALIGRSVAREVARRRCAVERCLFVGAAAARRSVARGLANTRTRAEIVDHVSLSGDGVRHGDVMHSVQAVILHNDIHRVILAPDEADTEEFLETISLVKSLGVRVTIVPRVFEVVGSSLVFDRLNGLTVLGVRQFGLARSSRVMKRAMDVVGATLALVTLSPTMIAVSITIRLTSKGPVLFRQTRVGRDGERFTMFKFRTMVDGADRMKPRLTAHNEADGLFKIWDDPRVTPVGRVLRRTSLDELPQLFNVLRGEMSLVGPRPLVVDEDLKIEGRHRRRLDLTPGMTGDWQILGSARIPLHEMVKIDYLYVANWSLWGDVKILVRTLVYVLRARGA